MNKTTKLKILQETKKIVKKMGWGSHVIEELKMSNKFKYNELKILFPDGYSDLINLSLTELNEDLINAINSKNIISLSLTKRVKKILMVKFNLLNKDKTFYNKTFNHLLLPMKSIIMKKNLYNSVDTIWYLAGDNSTDFNFYTKRIILASIYINALFIFYNKGLTETENNIDKNLKKISKIPKVKERLRFIKDNIPIFIKSVMN